jgi:cell division initiation protein
MKISPTAIRQKAFETSFRGFEKKQVTDFLEEMSVVMEQINQENLELRSRLQQVEGEAKRLKDVEDSLFRTLKTAEDTGAAIITEATEAADQIIAEANQIAEETTKQAQRYAEELGSYSSEQARIITTAAEESAKETMRSLTENIKGLIKSYEGLVEQREALVKSLRRLSQDALNQIDLSETHFARIDAKAYQRAVEELSRTNHFSAANSATLTTTASSSSVQREEVTAEPPQAEPQADNNEEQVASIDSEEFIETDSFFFDGSIPQMLMYRNLGLPHALRLSEYEKELPWETNYIWLDAFHSDWWIRDNILEKYRSSGEKIVLVSPEIHGRNPEDAWAKVYEQFFDGNRNVSVCTDRPIDFLNYG